MAKSKKKKELLEAFRFILGLAKEIEEKERKANEKKLKKEADKNK